MVVSIMGTRVLRKEDPKLLTVGGTYTADLRDARLEGAAHVCYARASALGAVSGVDVSGALATPGVLGVVTNSDLADFPLQPPQMDLFPEEMLRRSWLVDDAALFVGEPVAAVVAESVVAAVDGAEAVEVIYGGGEPATVIDLEDADGDAEVIFGEVGTNLALNLETVDMSTGFSDGDFFEDCEVVIHQRVENHKVAAVPLEGRSVACCWENGSLTVWMSTQAPHLVQGVFRNVYDLSRKDCRIIAPDVGGGFGQKVNHSQEEMLLPELARRFGRPMRWTETRTENLIGFGHGRAQVQRVTLGGDADGKVRRYRLEVICDSGAYPGVGAFLPYFTHLMASGTYDIAEIETRCRSVVTSTAPTQAYRGAGRPEATAAIERAVDIFAARCGRDPVEVRAQNLIAPERFPVTTAVGTEYDSGEYARALEKALEASGYEDLRREQARRRAEGDPRLLGIGVSCYVEITAGPAPGGKEYAKVEITPEGGARVLSGAFSHGQGHLTTFAMLASDSLGIPIEQVEVIQGDTAQIDKGVGTFGSRSLQLGGSAVCDASNQVIDLARETAADILEAASADVVFDAEKGFHVSGAPAVAVSWADLAERAEAPLSADSNFFAAASYPFGAHVAVVEVDRETGEVTLERMITCDDSGPLLNPMVAEGQRHGGIAQGAAQALIEEMRYDPWGNPVTSTFADYGIISAAELPSFELVVMETPSPHNPLGFKGIGESGTIGSTPAVQSAVVDALAHLGVTHVDIPCTPERVWRALS